MSSRDSKTISELMDAEPISEQREPDPVIDDAVRPVEKLSERHRRELAEQEEQFRLERRREQVQHEREKRERAEAVVSAASNAELLQRVAGLEAELVELARATDTVIQALECELARRSAEQARLETAVSKLELRIVEADRKAVLDLPPLLPSSSRSMQ